MLTDRNGKTSILNVTAVNWRRMTRVSTALGTVGIGRLRYSFCNPSRHCRGDFTGEISSS
jgi:hypothetical protein